MRVKIPYGTTAENNLLTLEPGELALDIEKKAIRFHDGTTQGGFEVVGERAVDPIAVWGSVQLPSLVSGVYRIVPTGIDGRRLAIGTVGAAVLTDTLDGSGPFQQINPGVNGQLRAVAASIGGNILFAGRTDGVSNGYGMRNSSVSTSNGYNLSQGGFTALGVLSVATNGSLWVMGGGNGLIVTTTSLPALGNPTLTQRATGAANQSVVDIIYANGMFVAVENTANPRVKYSMDGITWSILATYTNHALTRVFFINGRWYLTGMLDNEAIIYRSSGSNLTTSSWENIRPINRNASARALAYDGKGRWLLGLSAGMPLFSDNDMLTWSEVPTLPGISISAPTDIIFSDGYWLLGRLGANNLLYRSKA